jgi:ABC-2 type transport system ATP-binding protein
MMEDQNVIEVNGVYKDFKLPTQKVNSIKSIFTSFGRTGRKDFKIQKALEDINFSVKKGEFFGIVGRNGSGKSTLLKLLAGIYQPTKGSITVKGKVVPFIELGVGFKQELSGRDNVYLNGAMLGFTVKQIDAKYDSIVEFAELERFMEQKLSNYSSGMQVRLAFSVATILAESDVLLLDEVLAVGDADFQRKCFDYFRQLKKMKKTVIFISHDMDAVREYCDRAIIIDDARVINAGSAEEVSKSYTKLFLKQIENTETNPRNGDKRWGNGHAEILAPKAKVDEDNIVITHKVRNKQYIKSPVVGIRIKSVSGDVIMGTNTKIKLLSLDENKTATYSIEWAIPNILADGKFEVDIAVTEDFGLSTCDWWESALTIRVTKSEKVPYNVNPNVKVKKYDR